MGKSGKTYSITEEQLKNFAKTIAEETVKTFRKEEKNEAMKKQNRNLYNTRLLLENYRGLNEYAKSAIYSVEQLIEDKAIGEYEVKLLMKCGVKEDDLLIKSVASGAVRVKTLMAQVNKMLNVYRVDCETSSSETKKRRYRVINSLYLAEERKSTKEIADIEGEELRTIQNDAKAAREELTPLIFGIDGLVIKLFKETD